MPGGHGVVHVPKPSIARQYGTLYQISENKDNKYNRLKLSVPQVHCGAPDSLDPLKESEIHHGCVIVLLCHDFKASNKT